MHVAISFIFNSLAVGICRPGSHDTPGKYIILWAKTNFKDCSIVLDSHKFLPPHFVL